MLARAPTARSPKAELARQTAARAVAVVCGPENPPNDLRLSPASPGDPPRQIQNTFPGIAPWPFRKILAPVRHSRCVRKIFPANTAHPRRLPRPDTSVKTVSTFRLHPAGDSHTPPR